MSTDRDFVKVSKPYISYPALIFVRDNEPRNLTLNDLSGSRVAVPNDYTGEYFLRKNYPEINVVEADDPAHGIKLLSEGKVAAFFGGVSVVNYICERDGITNIRVSSPTKFEYANGFGVREDWAIFADIISKTLDRTTAAQHGGFYAKWISRGFNQKLFYQYAQFWWIVGSILTIAVAATGIAFTWNRKQAAFIDQLEAAKKLTDEANLKLDQARREATLWQALDLDGDGILSADEIDRAPTSLLALDPDGDGRLTEDEYGGPVENRARLLCEVVRACKARTGEDFPIWCRIDATEFGTNPHAGVGGTAQMTIPVEQLLITDPADTLPGPFDGNMIPQLDDPADKALDPIMIFSRRHQFQHSFAVRMTKWTITESFQEAAVGVPRHSI